MIGSHSDSVPSGGRFDGMAGVIAGLAIARTLAEQNIRLRHSLEIVDFLAEEPSEFRLSCIGSRGITGNLSVADLALRNENQETLGDALLRMGGRPTELKAARRTDLHAAFELHIEQGPVLEAEALDIGIVSAIVGITRLEIQFFGTAGHAGTTPMTHRRDPLLAAAHLVGWVRRCAEAMAARTQGHFVATVGVIEALPGATNVIPKSARIVVDARSEDPRLTAEFCQAIEAESLLAAAAANVERAAFTVQSSTAPAACDPALQRLFGISADASRLLQQIHGQRCRARHGVPIADSPGGHGVHSLQGRPQPHAGRMGRLERPAAGYRPYCCTRCCRSIEARCALRGNPDRAAPASATETRGGISRAWRRTACGRRLHDSSSSCLRSRSPKKPKSYGIEALTFNVRTDQRQCAAMRSYGSRDSHGPAQSARAAGF